MNKTSRFYNKEQDAFIIANYYTMDVLDIAKYVGTDKRSVWKRAALLGLRKKDLKRWSEQEDELIRFYWSKRTQQKIVAKLLNRHVSELSSRSKKIGCYPWKRPPVLRFGRPVTLLPDGSSVMTHRHVASKMVGRVLTPNDHVHHIDFDKFNNDESNLHIFTSAAAHKRCHSQFSQIVPQLFQLGIVKFDKENGLYILTDKYKHIS